MASPLVVGHVLHPHVLPRGQAVIVDSRPFVISSLWQWAPLGPRAKDVPTLANFLAFILLGALGV